MRLKNRKTFAFDTELQKDECAVCEEEEKKERGEKIFFV